MNQKKCPKCGETNPAEAVMCWACYTPLTGGAPAAAAPAAAAPAVGGRAPKASAAPVAEEAGEKKKIDPKIIGGVVVVVLLLIGAKLMLGGGGGGDEDSGDTNAAKSGDDKKDSGKPAASTPAVATGPVPASAGGGGSAPDAAAPSTPYFTVAQPNMRLNWATMGIVPSNPVNNDRQAASIAALAFSQFRKFKKWDGVHIYVFSNAAAGQVFANYQARRAGQPLTEEDFNALAQVWPSTAARYENFGGKARVLYPHSNPDGWWRGRPST